MHHCPHCHGQYYYGQNGWVFCCDRARIEWMNENWG